jgi:hypothetical protein
MLVTEPTKVIIYVKSVKTVTGVEEVERELLGRYVGHAPSRVKVEGKVSDGTFRLRQFEETTVPEYEFILPDDQQRFVGTVKEVAATYGIEVEVVDVTKENVLKREIQEHFKNLSVFPTAITNDGKRIERNVTKTQLEKLLSRMKPGKQCHIS